MTWKTKRNTQAKCAVTTAKKLPGKPFKAGADWTGNRLGRPKGSKHKLSEEFVAALCEDFEQQGSDVIKTVRTEKPADYLRVIASVIPKDLIVNQQAIEDLSDDELFGAIAGLRALAAALGLDAKEAPPTAGGSPSVN